MTDVSPEWERWVEAAKILAADPTAQVICPRNGDSYLQVTDTTASDGTVERRLKCPVCQATNVIRNPAGRASA
jgi:hypothetical protein